MCGFSLLLVRFDWLGSVRYGLAMFSWVGILRQFVTGNNNCLIRIELYCSLSNCNLYIVIVIGVLFFLLNIY